MNRRGFLYAMSTLALTGAAKPQLSFAADSTARFQVGCYTRPWDQHDYRTALDGIAEAGYKYAGIMTAKGKSWVMITPQTTPEESAQIGEEVRKRGLQTLSVYGDFSPAESLEQGLKALRRLIENCHACGSPNLLLGGTTDGQLVKRYYQTVTECCPFATTLNVSITIKPHGGQNATGPQCRKIIEQVNHPAFGLWYDPGNIFYYSDGKLDPVDDCATVDGLVRGVSVKDFSPPKEVMVTPGSGQVQFQRILARLRQGGFVKGPLIVECVARGNLAQVTAEARKARLFVEQLVP